MAPMGAVAYEEMKMNLRHKTATFKADEFEAMWDRPEEEVEDGAYEDEEDVRHAIYERRERCRQLQSVQLKIPLALRMFWLQVGGVCFADPSLEKAGFWMTHDTVRLVF